jgi:hypothetical protein
LRMRCSNSTTLGGFRRLQALRLALCGTTQFLRLRHGDRPDLFERGHSLFGRQAELGPQGGGDFVLKAHLQGICACVEQKGKLRVKILKRFRCLRRNSLFALEQGMFRDETGKI